MPLAPGPRTDGDSAPGTGNPRRGNGESALGQDGELGALAWPTHAQGSRVDSQRSGDNTQGSGDDTRAPRDEEPSSHERWVRSEIALRTRFSDTV